MDEKDDEHAPPVLSPSKSKKDFYICVFIARPIKTKDVQLGLSMHFKRLLSKDLPKKTSH